MVEQRKPYLRYSISGDIEERGIAFCIKQAANVFLKTHGYDGHVSELDVSSSNFNAVLELFDNGKYDFNPCALGEHIQGSGRLPSRENIRPEIVIKPLACDAVIQIHQDSPDYLAYKKSLDKFQTQLKENEEQLKQKEGTIKSLNNVLQERQGTIEEGEKKISVLEKKVSEVKFVKYTSLQDAISNGYLMDAQATYLDLSVDLTTLSESKDLEFFQGMSGRENSIFAEYVNSIYGTKFQSDKEFDKWKSKIDRLGSWEDLEQAKRIHAAKKPYLVNEKRLKLIEELAQAGIVDPTSFAMFKTKIIGGRAKLGELEKEIKSVQDKFDKDKELVSSMAGVTERYSQLDGVIKNSAQRRKAGITLPVVMEVYSDRPSIALFMPYDISNCPIEKLFYQTIQGNVQGFIPQGAELNRIVENNAAILRTPLSIDSEKSSEQLMIISGRIADEIKKNKTLKALGVQTVITIITDTRARQSGCLTCQKGKKN